MAPRAGRSVLVGLQIAGIRVESPFEVKSRLARVAAVHVQFVLLHRARRVDWQNPTKRAELVWWISLRRSPVPVLGFAGPPILLFTTDWCE